VGAGHDGPAPADMSDNATGCVMLDGRQCHLGSVRHHVPRACSSERTRAAEARVGGQRSGSGPRYAKATLLACGGPDQAVWSMGDTVSQDSRGPASNGTYFHLAMGTNRWDIVVRKPLRLRQAGAICNPSRKCIVVLKSALDSLCAGRLLGGGRAALRDKTCGEPVAPRHRCMSRHAIRDAASAAGCGRTTIHAWALARPVAQFCWST